MSSLLKVKRLVVDLVELDKLVDSLVADKRLADKQNQIGIVGRNKLHIAKRIQFEPSRSSRPAALASYCT